MTKRHRFSIPHLPASQLVLPQTTAAAATDGSTSDSSCLLDAQVSTAMPVANIFMIGLNIIVIGALIALVCLMYKRRTSPIRLSTRVVSQRIVIYLPAMSHHASPLRQPNEDNMHTQQRADKVRRPSTPYLAKLEGDLSNSPRSSPIHSPSYCSTSLPLRSSLLLPTSPISHARPLTPALEDLPSFHPLQKKRSWLETAKHSVVSISSCMRDGDH